MDAVAVKILSCAELITVTPFVGQSVKLFFNKLEGEIDILEYMAVATEPLPLGTYHWGYEAGKDKCFPACSTPYINETVNFLEFHVFAMEWNDSTMKWYIKLLNFCNFIIIEV